MPYFAVVLRRRAASGAVDEAVEAEHAGLIDGLIERALVVLGGGFPDGPEELYGAYVLRADTREAAEALAEGDPLVRAGAVTPRTVRWDLVAVDRRAVDRSLLVADG